MPTRVPPSSSKGQGKAGESAPKADTPMARFRNLAKRLSDVDPEKVRAMERKEKRMRAADRKPKRD